MAASTSLEDFLSGYGARAEFLRAYINFRCEHIDINTAMNKCQFERYRFTVFSVRNQMDLYRFVGFHSLRDLVNFVSCRVEAVQNGRQTETG